MKFHKKELVRSSIIIPAITLVIILAISYFSWFYFDSLFSYQEQPEHWQPMPLPELQTPVVLRVVYAENPRFKSLSDSQIKKILNKTSELVSQHLFVNVIFEQKNRTGIDELFNALPYVAKQYQSQKIIHVEDNNNSIESFKKIRDSIALQIKHGTNSAQSIIDYAAPYLIEQNHVSNLEELTAKLAETLVQRYQYWQQQQAEDGKAVLDGTPFNQWIFWDALGYGDLPYDVVITNQLVASIEENGMPVHTCLRGGLTGGNMTYNKQGRLGGYIFVSAFQMINDNELLGLLREDETYSEQQIIDYTAATITHELGHLLFHYAHPFNAQSCIMNPTPLLHYRQWYEQLDVDACQKLNSPMQQPGAARVTYNTQW